MKLPKIFIGWVMACVTDVQFNIHLNGRIHGKFKGGRGLRQGDPLSPLLFVLTMDYFSRMMPHVNTQLGFHFHPHCKKQGLTHLMFVDDLILFCKANKSCIGHIKTTLTYFAKSASLQANLHKSQLVLGGVTLYSTQPMPTGCRFPGKPPPPKIFGDPHHRK